MELWDCFGMIVFGDISSVVSDGCVLAYLLRDVRVWKYLWERLQRKKKEEEEEAETCSYFGFVK